MLKTICLSAASIGALLVAAGGAPALAEVSPTETPHYGTWGFDLAGRDLSVKPGDDFYRYVDGTYIDHLVIPADKSRYGSFDILRALSETRVHAILEELAANAPEHPTTDDGKIGAFYKAYMNEAAVEAAGVGPLQRDLAPIKAATNREQMAALMGKASLSFNASIFGGFINVDAKNPSAYAVFMTQAGLGMPNRDYYLKPEFADKKAAYEIYVTKILSLAGWPDAAPRAKDIIAYETRIAEASWTAADRRNPDTTYNPVLTADLSTFAPGFDWKAFMDAADLGGVDRVVVREKTAIPKIAGIFAETPMETLKAWAAFHLADNASAYLPDAFVQARFQFRTKSLSGAPELEVRWKRAVNEVGDLRGGMGDAVGRVYVARYFPPEARAKMQALVDNLRVAFKHRIETVDWMSPATKTEALDKLARYQIKIGYTSEWRNYSAVNIRTDDLYGDVKNCGVAEWDHEIGHLGKPVDRAEWGMTPQTVNAYNNSTLNEVVFPAAILQPPFFDPKADPAINYGGIVAVIGHEMTHGFDDQGRKYDGTGKLRDWWTPDDAKQFEARSAKYGAEFAAYDTGVGVPINPKLTMGENIADLGGLNLALDAYHASLDGKPAPVIDGYTGDQRVFLGWAQVWRGVYRPDALKRQLATDPHSPDPYRAKTAERNIDAWYKAFDVKPGDKLYLAPDDRVKIW